MYIIQKITKVFKTFVISLTIKDKTISLLPQNIERILIIKLRAIGDVLLSTPVIQNLRTQFPNAQIDFLTEKFASEVVIGNPYLNDVITFNKKTESSVSLIKKARSQKYDVVIDLFGNPRSALLTKLSGAKFRIGFPFRVRKFAYNILVTPRGNEVHNVEFNLDVLRKLEIPIHATQPYFPIVKEAEQFAQDWISHYKDGKMLIALNAGGGWYTKKWSVENFAGLAKTITKKYQAFFVILWGPGEKDDALKLEKFIGNNSIIIPPTTLSQMGAILRQCSYLISNDSGPMHIAATLQIPTLGIFGPTNPYLQGPYGKQHQWIRHEELECIACNLTSCSIGNICMKDLSVKKVFEAFDKLLKQNS